ncbi:MAG: GNAT family N-acetyltransferase [Williamsia sp.]|nr:GNAT family N-acetyltransferase [Williamsia sp.]
MDEISIRTIQPTDNAALASLVRTTLTEFGLNKPGTVYYDGSTDHLFELFQKEKSVYYVAEQEGSIIGGAGIYPSDGLPEGMCELVKMYLKPAARGKGLGRTLIQRCLDFAAAVGYTQVYLETMPELEQAASVYKKFGFVHLDQQLGNTGHFGCKVWMLKKLHP